MAKCERCEEDFNNFFNGYHWCPSCGLAFRFEKCELKDPKAFSKL